MKKNSDFKKPCGSYYKVLNVKLMSPKTVNHTTKQYIMYGQRHVMLYTCTRY
jgi:hypothetical protein